MRFGPQNHAGDREKGGLEEALECDWSLWEVPGSFSVPGQGQRCLGLPLSQVGQEGTGALLHFGLSSPAVPVHREGLGAPSLGWLQPLDIPMGVPCPWCQTRPWLCSLFVVVLICEM